MRDNHPTLKKNGYTYTSNLLQVSKRKLREALKEVREKGQVSDTSRQLRSVNTVAAQLSPEMRVWVQKSVHEMYSKLQSQTFNSLGRFTYPTTNQSLRGVQTSGFPCNVHHCFFLPNEKHRISGP